MSGGRLHEENDEQQMLHVTVSCWKRSTCSSDLVVTFDIALRLRTIVVAVYT
jgi:hypothetical protein